MPTVIMPKMGDGMEEGTLLRWLKAVGEEVEEGDPIARSAEGREVRAPISGLLLGVSGSDGSALLAPLGPEEPRGRSDEYRVNSAKRELRWVLTPTTPEATSSCLFRRGSASVVWRRERPEVEDHGCRCDRRLTSERGQRQRQTHRVSPPRRPPTMF